MYSADNHMLAHYQSLNGTNTFTIKERYLYGSDMLGKMAGLNAGATYTGNGNIIGPVWPIFDMKDQLGNNRIGFSYFSTGVQANISNDYYAFGWMMSQKFGGPTFGFNGKQIDDIKSGLGELYNYGAREYDPRIGRFMSMDPMANTYTMLTPYQYGNNSPVFNIDVEGKYFTGNIALLNQTLDYYRMEANSEKGAYRKEAREFLANIERMNESDIEFYIQSTVNKSLEPEAEGGKTSFNFVDNRVIIDAYNFVNTEHLYSVYQRLGHELEHGRQFMDGEIDFSTRDMTVTSTSTGMFFHDNYDEEKAFKAGRIIEGYFNHGQPYTSDETIHTLATYDAKNGWELKNVIAPNDKVEGDNIGIKVQIQSGLERGNLQYMDAYHYQPTAKQKAEKQAQQKTIEDRSEDQQFNK